MKKILLCVALILLVAFLSGCTSPGEDNTNPQNQGQADDDTAGQIDDDTGNQETSDDDTEEQADDDTGEQADDDTGEQADDDTVFELAEDDTTDDCLLLSVDDLNSICGVITTFEVAEFDSEMGQVCKTQFKTNDPSKSISLTFTGGYNPEAYGTLMDDCVNNRDGEELTDYACYNEGAGKSVTIHGKKWKIFLANSLPMEEYFICSIEQLKELGILVSERIYN